MTTIMTNTNLYLGKSLFGQINSFTCPDIEFETKEMKVGLGSIEVPVGIKAMSASLNLNSHDKEVLKKTLDPFGAINMTLYGSLDKFENDTKVSSKQAKLVLRGISKKSSTLGEAKPQETSEPSFDFAISAMKLYIANEEILNLDIPNFIWRQNGVDKVAELKKNLGLI